MPRVHVLPLPSHAAPLRWNVCLQPTNLRKNDRVRHILEVHGFMAELAQGDGQTVQ